MQNYWKHSQMVSGRHYLTGHNIKTPAFCDHFKAQRKSTEWLTTTVLHSTEVFVFDLTCST